MPARNEGMSLGLQEQHTELEVAVNFLSSVTSAAANALKQTGDSQDSGRAQQVSVFLRQLLDRVLQPTFRQPRLLILQVSCRPPVLLLRAIMQAAELSWANSCSTWTFARFTFSSGWRQRRGLAGSFPGFALANAEPYRCTAFQHTVQQLFCYHSTEVQSCPDVASCE